MDKKKIDDLLEVLEMTFLRCIDTFHHSYKLIYFTHVNRTSTDLHVFLEIKLCSVASIFILSFSETLLM